MFVVFLAAAFVVTIAASALAEVLPLPRFDLILYGAGGAALFRLLVRKRRRSLDAQAEKESMNGSSTESLIPTDAEKSPYFDAEMRRRIREHKAERSKGKASGGGASATPGGKEDVNRPD